MFSRIVQIEVHLARIRVAGTCRTFKSNDKSRQRRRRWKKRRSTLNQVSSIRSLLLTTEEGEVVTQFQQEICQVVESEPLRDRFLSTRLSGQETRVRRGLLIASSGVTSSRMKVPASLSSIAGLFLRKRQTLVKLTRDLTIKLPYRPAGAQSLPLVEASGFLGLD